MTQQSFKRQLRERITTEVEKNYGPFLTKKETKECLNYSENHINTLVREGLFPRPIYPSPRSSRRVRSDIVDHMVDASA